MKESGMRKFRDLPFVKKQRFIILLTSAIVLLLASGAFLVNQLFKLHQSLVTELYTLADSVAFSSDVSIVFLDTTTTEQSLSILKGNPRIEAAHVFTDDGALFANYKRPAESEDKNTKSEETSDSAITMNDKEKIIVNDTNTPAEKPVSSNSGYNLDNVTANSTEEKSESDYPFDNTATDSAKEKADSDYPFDSMATAEKSESDYPFDNTATDSAKEKADSDYPFDSMATAEKSESDYPFDSTATDSAKEKTDSDYPFDSMATEEKSESDYPFDDIPAYAVKGGDGGAFSIDGTGEFDLSTSLFNYYPPFKGVRPESFDLEKVRPTYFYSRNHIDVFRPVTYRGKRVGMVHIRSNLKAFYSALFETGAIAIAVLLVSMILASIIAILLQKVITKPLLDLVGTMNTVYREQDYSLRQEKHSNDEIGTLVDGFNAMLGKIEARDRELALANEEISELNDRLKEDNLRMGAELEVTRQLQQMVLPNPEELEAVNDLDIAGFMEPADEVGGDYYDVLTTQTGDGGLKIAIGDVTGHGLESGVVMLMVQTAVRTLLEQGVSDPHTFMTVLNRAIYRNIQRMRTDKNLTLSLMDYNEGNLRVVGQHEDVLVVRHGGRIELLNTVNLGFMVGLMQDISSFVGSQEVYLNAGESVILYTDGVTEAMNEQFEMYGQERLCQIISQNWDKSAAEIEKAVIGDVKRHMGSLPANDDITLVVIKRKQGTTPPPVQKLMQAA
jgi:serine phosphatase RsbU (regulator of sigma subunit)